MSDNASILDTIRNNLLQKPLSDFERILSEKKFTEPQEPIEPEEKKVGSMGEVMCTLYTLMVQYTDSSYSRMLVPLFWSLLFRSLKEGEVPGLEFTNIFDGRNVWIRKGFIVVTHP
ncbi:MAG: hypothetical protein CEO40_288 [Parcubacteria group bacterium LiPW_72]|nr:MAG: hypothetical protein CEO40_288 [Parcubacteria group bacterium LiPW_72]